MTRAKPVIAAKRKKRSPRCIGNDLGQMLTHSQFTNRSVRSQEVRGATVAEELRELRLSKQIPAKDMVAVVQAIYPKYDKTVQSKCENGDAYGVSLRPDAMAALYSHFAPELAESRKTAKKDAHRLTCRISARLETADYEALQRLIEAEGYATTQDWLTATVRRYIAEAGETE